MSLHDDGSCLRRTGSYQPSSDARTFRYCGSYDSERKCELEIVLWVLAVILVISGIGALIRKEMLWGIVLIIVGLLVGPGGVSIFS